MDKWSTPVGFAIPRIQMDDTADDRKAIQSPLSQVVMYPLSQFDGKMKSVDWSKIPSVPVPAGPPNQWANPETYFDDLPAVMKEVPALPGEEALYGQIAAVFEAAAKDPWTAPHKCTSTRHPISRERLLQKMSEVISLREKVAQAELAAHWYSRTPGQNGEEPKE